MLRGLGGLEVVQAFREAGLMPERPIVVAAFTNEEGVRYAPDMMGSLVYAGGLEVEEALATVGTDGSVLGDELARIGSPVPTSPASSAPMPTLNSTSSRGRSSSAKGSRSARWRTFRAFPGSG